MESSYQGLLAFRPCLTAGLALSWTYLYLVKFNSTKQQCIRQLPQAVFDLARFLIGYRRYVYEAGAVDRSEKLVAGVIGNAILEKEWKNDFDLKRVRRFRYRTRYFTDSGIIGTKEFVSSNYHRFKDLFMSKREKIPRPVAGLDGVFSLKRLAEG